MGPKCAEFEEAFATLLNAKHALAVNSCTAALHLAYQLAGVGPDMEVIVPSQTFAATVNAVTYLNATPVFADICSTADWTIDPEDIAAKITPRTAAIVAMHYGGYPCDMKRIMDVADSHNIPVIEDACHGLGGSWNGRQMGTIGRIGCFSFYSNKVITTGEGGMLVTDDDALAERCHRLRSHGQTALSFDQIRGAIGYDITEVGYNYRLDDMRAALGLAQLQRMAESVSRRKKLVSCYMSELEQFSEVLVPHHGSRGDPANYIFAVLLADGIDRTSVQREMYNLGVQTSYHYPPVHTFSHFKGLGIELPVTDEISGSMLTLPLYPRMTEEMVSQACNALRTAIDRVGKAI